MAHRLAQSWHALFWRGAVAIAFALTTFAWPMITLTALLMIFGAFALIDGALTFVIAVRESPRSRWSMALFAEGVAGVLAGALALFVPGIAITLILALIAVWAVTTGLLEIAAATALKSDGGSTAALIAGGAVSILAGVLIVARPALGAVAIAWILGAYAMVFGVILLTLSVRLRRDNPFRRMSHRGLS